MVHKKGLFITLEGGEGAGKSTLLRRLSLWFTEENRPFFMTREPGGTPFAEEIRCKLLEKREEPLLPKSELFLFLAARVDHVEKVIRPKLEAGMSVICDRFHDSTVAYQGIARSLGLDKVRELSLFAAGGLDPDITLFIDLPPEEGFKRIKERSQDRIEKEGLDFHERIYNGFQELVKRFPTRIFSLQGSLPEEALFLEAKNVISSYRQTD